jgi:hypothetical protein
MATKVCQALYRMLAEPHHVRLQQGYIEKAVTTREKVFLRDIITIFSRWLTRVLVIHIKITLGYFSWSSYNIKVKI